MDKEFTYGQMVEDMKANGKIIKCMAMVFSPGRMEESKAVIQI